jgi:hypothetical protein
MAVGSSKLKVQSSRKGPKAMHEFWGFIPGASLEL